MTSLVSDALAGFSSAIKSASGKGDMPENPNTPHYHFIHSTLLPLTVKLQKELRGRKFKEVQNKLQEAAMGMHTFQFENWPPETVYTKSNTISLGDHFMEQQQQNRQQNGGDEDMTVDTEAESTMGDFSKAPEEEEEALQTFDDVAATPNATPGNAAIVTTSSPVVNTAPTTVSAAAYPNPVDEDDPQTREKLHESILHATEAYVLIMLHPSKTNKACEITLDCIAQLVDGNYISGRAGGRDDLSGSGSAAVKARLSQNPDGGTIGSSSGDRPSLMHRLMTGIQKCSESSTDTVQEHAIKAFKAIMTSPKCGVHEASMLLAIRSIFHIYLVTKSKTVQESAKEALMDMVANIILRTEEKNALFHTDSYYLLRSLCKLSSKALPGIDDTPNLTPANFIAQQFLTNSSTVDPLALNNKVLSLELLLQIMDCAGNAICNGEKFIHLVQSQLCVSLLKNCMSNHSQVAFLSQKVFLILVYKFKIHLKDEIQVFMSNIFLRVLDSENSSFPQKALVLESLRSLCNDPTLLTTIFLHYDCDFDAMNLYKDIVFHLTKLSAKSTAALLSSKKDAEELQELSLAAVEVLVTILQAFLKALGITVTNIEANDTAGKKIRKTLELENVGKFLRRDGLIASNSVMDSSPVSSMHDSIHHLELSSNNQSSAELNKMLLQHQNSSASVAGQIVDAFDRKRNAEQNFELGAVKFTLSIKSGLNFFIDNGFVTLHAKDIAEFFLVHKDKLDKTQMGEVLGKEPDAAFLKTPTDPDKGGPGFYFRILHYYIEALDFSGLMFDDAIRLFLSGFRLPGEAQKIDRIMEKFAQRYTMQNVEVFPNADTAFILAFSVIMLNTDLHNPSIKPERRMTLDSFIRNNRGIGEHGADLKEDFLTGIFERIKAHPFSLKEDDAAREKAASDVMETSLNIFGDNGGYLGAGIFGTSTEERKREKFKKEREEMMTSTEQLIRRRKGKTTVSTGRVIDGVAPADVVKPMFDVTWGPIIGILSQVLEFSNDEQSIDVCLNGFVYAIRIAAHSHMSLARDTFVNSLAKFTFLGSIKEMKHKNIEAVRTLMSIAISDGEYLGESWGPVLQCISQLARMRMSASGLDSDESFLQDSNQTPSKRSSMKTSETAEMNAKAILESIGEELIDSVFSSTTKLSAHSLGHFIKQLVSVSSAEVEGDSKRGITGVAASASNRKLAGSLHGSVHGDDGPSIFSLQRLVEVADFNMDVRPRLVWAQVWEIMADYFAEIGCHRNSVVSVFAIDSLRQLSSKFLEKPELSEFHFQRIFLRPFLLIMENPETRPENRELILECMSQLINSRSHNLQSGWKIIFDVLMTAAKDQSEKLTHLSLTILQRLLDEHLDQLCCNDDGTDVTKNGGSSASNDDALVIGMRNRDSNADDFVGMCRASLSFVQGNLGDESPSPVGVSLRALCHTAIYADLIAAGRILPPLSGTQCSNPDGRGFTYGNLSEPEALEMTLWRPIFEGLASCLKSNASSRDGGVGCLVQRGSVLAFRSILLRHGNLFSSKQLRAILKDTLIPAIQSAAESDLSPVIAITSESPAVSNLDFLVEPMPIPPPRYDRGLLKFEEVARSLDCAPKRPLGPAELLLEASFTDMRHAGDGDLTQVYRFAKKDMNVRPDDEQPFPDSWIATTAPVALGCLTDIATEVILQHGSEGSRTLWPLVGDLIRRWCNGESNKSNKWAPCEALVRIACREVSRFAVRLNERLSRLDRNDAVLWSNTFACYYADLLNQTLQTESRIKTKLLEEKLQAYRLSNAEATETGIQQFEKVDIHTPYGRGLVVDRRIDDYGEEGEVTVDIVNLTFGTLYRAKKEIDDELERSADGFSWVKLVPVLKIRCVAAHLLHQALIAMGEGAFVPLLHESVATDLLRTLNFSRELADEAVKNEDMAHAFQEATYNEWGLDEDLEEEALVNVAKMSHTRGSAMFFLTQSAGATNAAIQILTALYEFEESKAANTDWDREKFAAPYLLDLMKDVLVKFIESESRERHRIDPNVWRNASESGVKIAVYCTSFASVVVGLLKAMLSFDQTHIERNKHGFFPMICRLVRVQNDEIRQLVQSILLEKFAPLLGVENGC